MYIYTPLCRYWIALYRHVLVFIVPHVDIELEDNKQFISNIPRTTVHVSGWGLHTKKTNKKTLWSVSYCLSNTILTQSRHAQQCNDIKNFGYAEDLLKKSIWW